MDYLKLFSCQMPLFALGAAMSFLIAHYISPPLTGIDLLAAWITYLLGGI